MTKIAALHLLFVCTGNTCRSPMAQYMMQHQLSQLQSRPNWIISSGGLYTAALTEPMSPLAVSELKKRGIKEPEHRSHLLTLEDLNDADQVYAMTRGIRDNLFRKFGSRVDEKKVFVLGEAAGFSDPDIEDPHGRDKKAYERSAAKIEAAIKELLKRQLEILNAQDPR